MILNSPYITGSLTVTGNATIAGNITVTGSLSGTATTSSFALTLQGTGSVGFATTGAFSATSGSASSRLTQIEQVYATTGSNSFRATQSITGSLTVTGQIIAQTLNVQQVTSSIVFSSGSNTFGCDLNSRQTFTGSVLMTGSLIVNTTGPELQVNNNGVIIGNLLTDNHSITGSLRITGSTTVFAGSIGINGSPGNSFPIESYINSSTTYTSTSRGNVLRVYNSNATANVYAGIELGGAGPSNDGLVGINGIVTAAGSGDLSFYTRNSNTFGEKMRINSCGNMGINVSCPANLLHLAGASATPSLRLGSISTGFHWDIGRENATTGDFIFNNANGGCTFERLRITTCGSVGIGTNCPATKLTVYPVTGGICGTNDAIRLQVQSYENAARNTIVWGQDSSNLILARFGLEWNLGTSQMNFVWRDMYNSVTGSTELMRLTGGGNLGIGTSVAPAVNGLGLAIYASDYPRITLRNSTSGDTTGDGLQIAMVGANVQYDLAESGYQMWTTGGTERMRITSGGCVGIGTNCPTREMVLYRSSGEVHFKLANGTTGQGQADGFDMAIDSAGAGYFLQREAQPINFYTSAAERMRINSSGGVRIGSTSAFNDDIRFNVYGTGVWDGANIGLQNGGSGGKDWIIFSTMCAFGQGAGNLLFYNNSGPTSNALIIYANGNYDFGGSDVSDLRLKQCIQNLNYGVNEIMQLSPKSYNLKSEDNLQQENQTVLRKRYGFVAQEVQPILPDTITGQETETDYLGLDYNGVLAVAVKAIQEQQCTICSQATMINTLKTCLGIA
mgnify:CR=1 FL=1